MIHRMERAPSQRPLRVGEEIRHALALVFERGELRDPALSDVSVTVSEVRVSPDLRQATVFVLPLGGGQVAEILAALTRAKGFLKARIAERVRLKYMPDLSFRFDESFAQASHIAELIARARAVDAGRQAGEAVDDADVNRDGADGGLPHA